MRTGDVVWSRNPVTGKNVRAKVIRKMHRTATAMMVITVAGVGLQVTTEHPFHTSDRGWVQSDKLQAGDTLDLVNGKTATIQTVARYSTPTTVYNFTVKGEHNYFAGPTGVLVHNSGGACGSGGSTYYRSMSEADYSHLQSTGGIRGTTETTSSPTRGLSESYNGALVEFRLHAGTIDRLAEIGVSDGTDRVGATFPEMPRGSTGWGRTSARFKAEGGQINIGLGRGPGVDIFNAGIEAFSRLR